MDGRGGCCIARYATGSVHDMSKVDRIMLKYRPIAPKPATNSSGSGNSTLETSSKYVKTGRGKRRYARNSVKRENNGMTKRCKCKSRSRKRKSSSPEEDESHGKSTVSTGSVSGGGANVVALPLLPETPPEPIQDESPARAAFEKAPLWLNFGSNELHRVPADGFWVDGRTAGEVVGTWVRVEYISETWVAGYGNAHPGLGCTDQEKLMNLESDTCPGFISDGLNRVRWVNRAYREMAVGQEGMEKGEVLVWLVTKEGLQLPPNNWAGFTCGVRVVTRAKEKNSVILPCDVWRLEGGQGFAWRLDTKAALSLGR